jgi:SAM-dependent methyltransferase
MTRAAAAAAFDAESAVYDEAFGRNPIGRLFRSVFQERLAALLPAGARVLDVGCGTGDDALFLAARGVAVHALDPAPGMVAQTRAKAEGAGLPTSRLAVEVLPAEEVAACGTGFDGAYSDFGALNCVDLEAFGRGLASALRPGAAVLFSVMGRYPLPATVLHALTGRGPARGGRTPRVAGRDVPTDYPSPRRFREALGPGYAWRPLRALGVVVPDPGFGGWAERHPRLLSALATVEAAVRDVPGLRALGDHLLFEGRRV